MHSAQRWTRTCTVALFSIALLAGCGALAHPLSNDGSDAGNPIGANPGTQMLVLSAPRTDLGVGDDQPITATYGGATLFTNVAMTATVSDSSVIAGSGFGALALSVGGATITATYQGSTASIGFTVHPQYGLNAMVAIEENTIDGVPIWRPATVRVAAGSSIQFYVNKTHNVVFDSTAGAPPNIPTGGSSGFATRTFNTAGTFPYTCTVHGEQGVVVVTP